MDDGNSDGSGRVLPLNVAIALGLDPIIDAVDEPAARPAVLVVGLALRRAELEAAGGAAGAVLVPPLEAFALLGEVGALSGAGPVALADHCVPLLVRVQALGRGVVDAEVGGLADLGAGAGGEVGATFEGVLVVLGPLAGLFVLAGAVLVRRVRADVADVVRGVVPVRPEGDKVGREEGFVQVLDLENCLSPRVLVEMASWHG